MKTLITDEDIEERAKKIYPVSMGIRYDAEYDENGHIRKVWIMGAKAIRDGEIPKSQKYLTATGKECYPKINIMETNKEITKVDKWFKTNQIETSINGERKVLIINHQCGEDKEALIGQLKMMINGVETDFDGFAS